VSVTWNPWHGCKKYSEGCLNCYVFRIDGEHDIDSRVVKLNARFDLPVKRGKGRYKIKPGDEVYTCLSSDFFLEEADEWRGRAWEIIAGRRDLIFIIITKRILRAAGCFPADWGDGYEHVHIGVTCENQRRADERLPVFLRLPIKHRFVVCEPLLEKIELSPYLGGGGIERVVAGGESGPGARVCDWDWVVALRHTCAGADVAFNFRQTGALFRKDGRIYRIPRKHQLEQAARAGIDFAGRE
jgi:protein gp37